MVNDAISDALLQPAAFIAVKEKKYIVLEAKLLIFFSVVEMLSIDALPFTEFHVTVYRISAEPLFFFHFKMISLPEIGIASGVNGFLGPMQNHVKL